MYVERGPRVTYVNRLSIITLQNMVLDMRNESRKQSEIEVRLYSVCDIGSRKVGKETDVNLCMKTT